MNRAWALARHGAAKPETRLEETAASRQKAAEIDRRISIYPTDTHCFSMDHGLITISPYLYKQLTIETNGCRVKSMVTGAGVGADELAQSEMFTHATHK